MKGQGNLLRRLAEQTSLGGQPLPGLPIVEIAGDGRVLIENHQGIREYEGDRICVAVKYGLLRIEGSCLELAMMSGNQLVIIGKIDRIMLERGLSG